MCSHVSNTESCATSIELAMSESLLDFPARVTVKAMGLSSEEYIDTVKALVLPHLDAAASADIKTNSSSGGKYTSVNITFVARDQAHLEGIYKDLHACKEVLYTL